MIELVGILNITPDSFSDGGLYLDPDTAVKRARQMIQDGASIIDIGAESTRPNADSLTSEQEWQRLEPVLEILNPEFPGRISLDSYHPETIIKAFKIGPVIVNDVTGLNNPEMVKVIVKLDAKVIISHLPGVDIQKAHREGNVSDMQVVKKELLSKAELLISKGHKKENIILDPGIGFGKTMDLNRELLKFADFVPDYKVMIGYSRKRFLGEKRMDLEPNLAAGRIAAAHGAKYLRVHDVAGHRELIARTSI